MFQPQISVVSNCVMSWTGDLEAAGVECRNYSNMWTRGVDRITFAGYWEFATFGGCRICIANVQKRPRSVIKRISRTWAFWWMVIHIYRLVFRPFVCQRSRLPPATLSRIAHVRLCRSVCTHHLIGRWPLVRCACLKGSLSTPLRRVHSVDIFRH